jgi:sec-independent protein translocase protein TatA
LRKDAAKCAAGLRKEHNDMGSMSVWHWLMFLAVALLVFGGSGKISSIMGDVAKGIKSFKKGMAEDDEAVKKDEPAKPLESIAVKQPEPSGQQSNKAS